jgi:hypothetical protein
MTQNVREKKWVQLQQQIGSVNVKGKTNILEDSKYLHINIVS